MSGALSVEESQVLRQFDLAVGVGILAAADSPAGAVAWGFRLVECALRRHLERVRAGTAQGLVERGQLCRRELVELVGDIAQLAAQGLDVLELVTRRWAIPGSDRPVELVGVLAQPLFAGDRAALSSRDDALAQRVQLAIEVG